MSAGFAVECEGEGVGVMGAAASAPSSWSEARASWGAGREVRWRSWWWLSWSSFGGCLSRREFGVFVLAYLGLGSLVLWSQLGVVPWFESPRAWWWPVEAPWSWSSRTVAAVVFVGTLGAVVRRWRDAGLPWFGLLFALAFCWSGSMVLIALVVLALVAPAGWIGRWEFMSRREKKRAERVERQPEPESESRFVPSTVSRASSLAGPGPQPREVEPVVPVEEVESEEKLLEFLRGGWDDE